MTDYAIEIGGLEREFDDFHLGPISLKVPKGCIMGYIGGNGSGKSSTIKLILDLLHKDAGTINVLGKPMAGRNRPLMNKIGVVFDDLYIPKEMRVREVQKMCSMLFDYWQSEVFSDYQQKFELPLAPKVKDLSRGMRIKLSLAIALSHKAELLILDEATTGLDPAAREEILDIFRDFVKDDRHTIFISSHMLQDLERVADFIAFIHKGKLVFVEKTEKLKEKYALCTVDNSRLEKLDPKAVIARRKNAFGYTLLVKRKLMPEGIELIQPSIEDIMVYTIKGENNESTTL